MKSLRSGLVVSVGAASAAWMISGDARAFSLSSALSEGCHEGITETALRNVRMTAGVAPAIDPSSNERTLVDDLPLDLPSDMREIAAASLLVGVRDNDLKGRSPTAVDQLALVHGNPDAQEEHCLRAKDDDEPDGSAKAIARCRAFIHDRVLLALSGLGVDGAPDATQRTDIKVFLSLRGSVSASLPLFWVHMGQAMHTLQDSFAHAFRTPDGMQITTVLNWIDFVEKDERESRDGPVHRTPMDQCNAHDDLVGRNKRLATEASTALLSAALDATMTVDQKMVAVDAVLTRYLSYSPGCSAADAWCNAPENNYKNATAGCGCAVVGGGDVGGGDVALGGFGLATLAAAVVARGRKRRGLARAAIVGCALLAALSPRLARAADAPNTTPATKADETTPAPKGVADGSDAKATVIPERTVAEEKAAVKEHAHDSKVALAASLGGSFFDPGAAGTLGVRFRLSETFVVGLDGELNYWYGVNDKRFQAGAASLYATGIARYPMRFEAINLRSTVHLGAAYELLDLYGVPRGSTGLFLGFFPLGVEWKLTGHVFLIVNPLGIAVPVPHLTGAPFAYPQFRTQVGVEVSL